MAYKIKRFYIVQFSDTINANGGDCNMLYPIIMHDTKCQQKNLKKIRLTLRGKNSIKFSGKACGYFTQDYR
jgi:hypothetical protein